MKQTKLDRNTAAKIAEKIRAEAAKIDTAGFIRARLASTNRGDAIKKAMEMVDGDMAKALRIVPDVYAWMYPEEVLDDETRRRLSVIAVTATGEVEELLEILERYTGEKVLPANRDPAGEAN